MKRTVLLSGEASAQMKTIAILIQKASDFASTIYVRSDGRRANAKSLLGLMSLGLLPGHEISIEAEGEDAEQAVQTLADWLENPSE